MSLYGFSYAGCWLEFADSKHHVSTRNKTRVHFLRPNNSLILETSSSLCQANFNSSKQQSHRNTPINKSQNGTAKVESPTDRYKIFSLQACIRLLSPFSPRLVARYLANRSHIRLQPASLTSYVVSFVNFVYRNMNYMRKTKRANRTLLCMRTTNLNSRKRIMLKFSI